MKGRHWHPKQAIGVWLAMDEWLRCTSLCWGLRCTGQYPGTSETGINRTQMVDKLVFSSRAFWLQQGLMQYADCPGEIHIAEAVTFAWASSTEASAAALLLKSKIDLRKTSIHVKTVSVFFLQRRIIAGLPNSNYVADLSLKSHILQQSWESNCANKDYLTLSAEQDVMISSLLNIKQYIVNFKGVPCRCRLVQVKGSCNVAIWICQQWERYQSRCQNFYWCLSSFWGLHSGILHYCCSSLKNLSLWTLLAYGIGAAQTAYWSQLLLNAIMNLLQSQTPQWCPTNSHRFWLWSRLFCHLLWEDAWPRTRTQMSLIRLHAKNLSYSHTLSKHLKCTISLRRNFEELIWSRRPLVSQAQYPSYQELWALQDGSRAQRTAAGRPSAGQQ